MSAIVLGTAVAAFAGGLVTSSRAWLSGAWSMKGDLLLVSLAWAAVFIGQGQMFAHDHSVTGFSTLTLGALYQLGWMVVGSALIAWAFLTMKLRIRGATIALAGLLAYGVLGVASAAFSPAVSLSLYKAGQILMDAALVAVALSATIRLERPRAILNLTYFLLALVLASAALGGVLWPDHAYKDVEGAFTGVLNGVYPQVHSNELGLLGAIMLVVGVRRASEPGTGLLRLYWLAVAVLAGTVLFYAQARTSLASSMLAIVVLAIFIPRLRPLAALGGLAVIGLLVWQWLGGLDLHIEGTVVETYLRRGASDAQIESLSGRIGLWMKGWEMFKDAPLFGHGMDAGVRYGGTAYGVPLGTNMHSAHIQILANNGITGYLAWLIFVLATVAGILKALLRTPGGMRGEEGRLRLEMLLVAFVIVFRSFLGHVLVTHHFSFLVFLALLVCATASMARRAQTSSVNTDDDRVTKDGLLARRSDGVWKAVR